MNRRRQEPVDGRGSFRIRHPSFGYFLKIERTDNDSCKFREQWTKDIAKAPAFTLSDLRQARDANNNGLMALLVASYGGLKLEVVT